MPLCYCPILKTTTAELRGLENLSPGVSKDILPIIELTRSRRSKHNPDGDIGKRIDQIEDILEERPFILDVTTEQSMSNAQIDGILHGGRDGFQEWIDLVGKMQERGLRVIPVIHYDPKYKKGVRKQIDGLLEVSPTLAFRAGPWDQDLGEYLKVLSSSMDVSNVILILDAGYLSLSVNPKGNFASHFSLALKIAGEAGGSPKAIVCAFSSFPDSVTRKHYGGDEHGEFPVAELITHRSLRDEGVIAGDYASVHPVRYEMGGGTWIPRIDFIGADDKFHYYRYRREDGGYVRAAKHVRRDKQYKMTSPPTWGDDEMQLAAEGEPSGKSPLHWIAVRVNSYITRLRKEFRKGPHISL